MLCKDCEHFQILCEPMKDVDFGHAVCKKHNLTTDFLSHKKFEWLECVETERGEEQDEQNGQQKETPVCYYLSEMRL